MRQISLAVILLVVFCGTAFAEDKLGMSLLPNPVPGEITRKTIGMIEPEAVELIGLASQKNDPEFSRSVGKPIVNEVLGRLLPAGTPVSIHGSIPFLDGRLVTITTSDGEIMMVIQGTVKVKR